MNRSISFLFSSLSVLAFACTAAPADQTPKTNEAPVVTKTQMAGQSLGAKQISLTFDDGPGPRTLELGAYLQQRGIQGTFFVVGKNVTDGGVLQALRDQGHLVASHTFDHKALPSLTSTDVVWEISATHERIAPYVDKNHLLLRAPYGAWSGDVAAAINASPYAAYVGSIFWDVGGALTASYGADWDCWGKGLAVEDCGQRYVNEIDAKGKGIVLMHDVHGRTIDMVKWMVPVLEAAGYAFVRTDEVPDIASALGGGGTTPPTPKSDLCATRQGRYCARAIGGAADDNRLVICDQGVTVGTETCAKGCKEMPPGQPDVCADG